MNRKPAFTTTLRASILVAGMIISLALSVVLHPVKKPQGEVSRINLESMLPKQFDNWHNEQQAATSIINPQAQATLDRIYNQTLSRVYVDSDGHRIMLSLAYGSEQTDELKAHRPEVCYPAQGFQVRSLKKGTFVSPHGTIPVTRLVTSMGNRIEPVTYWISVSGIAAADDLQRKLAQLRFGLTGTIPDGMLIRVSSIDPATDHAFSLQEAFIESMVKAMTDEDKSALGFSNRLNTTQ